MGLLDQILSGGAQAGSARAAKNRSVNSKLAAGVLVALAVKHMRDRQRSAESRTFDPSRSPGAPQGSGMGDILGGLGGMLGGRTGGGGTGGLGGILGGLGGAGALGGLIGQLQNRGLGQQANSWVGTGANQPVAPNQLADALGDDTVQELQEQTGLPRDQLLAQLAHELPDAVNQATPKGQLPDDQELDRIAGA